MKRSEPSADRAAIDKRRACIVVMELPVVLRAPLLKQQSRRPGEKPAALPSVPVRVVRRRGIVGQPTEA